jgi:hypothetical protein
LSDSRIGDFRVTACLNATCQTWREQIEELFADASREESLLLYISGHAIKDRDGRLYFAASDTRLNRLIATGVASTLIQDASNNSRSQRIAMIFDTCFSGAFAKGVQIKADSRSLNAGEYFQEGAGKVIITASDALQYALAGDSIDGGATVAPSVFSKHLIEGLRTGEADTDEDGQITTEDLFQYVSRALSRDGAQQRPQRWSFGVTHDFVIATNPSPKPGKLPSAVAELISDERSAVRLIAVDRLKAFLASNNVPLALAARRALEELRENDSRAVAAAASAALASAGEPIKGNSTLPMISVMPRNSDGKSESEPTIKEGGSRGSTQPKNLEHPGAPSTAIPSPLQVTSRTDGKKWQPWVRGVMLACLFLAMVFLFVNWFFSQKTDAPAPYPAAVARAPATAAERADAAEAAAAAAAAETAKTADKVSGKPLGGNSHLLMREDGRRVPERGYMFANDDPKDLSVQWVGPSGTVLPFLSHVVVGTTGLYAPEPGYEWVEPSNDHSLAVRPR